MIEFARRPSPRPVARGGDRPLVTAFADTFDDAVRDAADQLDSHVEIVAATEIAGGWSVLARTAAPSA